MSRTALIVDDSASIRHMVSLTLKSAGFDVVEGGDGRQALERLTEVGGRVDIIITDLNMPIMDGLEFIREVRTQSMSRFTPILMLTTESHESRKAEGKAAGATGWIVKPFHPDQLLRVVEKVLPE